MFGWNETAWFSFFVGTALKSTAVLCAAWLCVLVLRRRSAAARHLVWTAAAAAVLVLPFLSAALPVLSLPVHSGAAVLFQTTATALPDAANRPNTPRAGDSQPSQPSPWRPDWRLFLMLLWASGTVTLFAQTVIACAAMWRMRRAAKPSPDRALSVELARQLGIRDAVEVLETAEGVMPMTFGILRPAVFMPAGASRWSDERRRMVLLHELAHVSRTDVMTQQLARLAVILNWWNPLAWIAWREFLRERERATDDLVLHAGASASGYAGHLLEVARSLQSPPNLGWAAVAMARRSQLEGRLLAILDSGVNRTGARRVSVVAAILAAIAIVAPLAAVRAQDRPRLPADVEAVIREAASGKQGVESGLALMKLAGIESKRNHPKEAEDLYAQALLALGDRAEAAPALLYLGIHKKTSAEAIDYLRKAQLLDPALAGPAVMWMALIREREPNPAEAEALYKSSLAAENPTSSDAQNTRVLYARFLKNQGRDDEATAMLDQAGLVRKALDLPVKTSSGVLQIGPGILAPSVLYKLEPEYTEEARVALYSGTAALYTEIGPDGVPRNIQIVRSLGFGLDEKAIEAIRMWRFKPAMKGDAPVTVKAQIEVNFRLF